MIVLGIEGSANKLGVGVIRDDEPLSNVRKTYITPQGTGFVPAELTKHHALHIVGLVRQALSDAKVGIRDVDLVCYTKGPGIASALEIGATVARTLRAFLGVPIIGVNHCVAHIEMGRLVTRADNPVVLYASGGNTQVIAYKNGRYSVYGETIDVAAGNCIDRVARALNLPNEPAPGYQVEQLAKKGVTYIDLPYVVKGMNVSFSGLCSRVEALAATGSCTKEDLCFSMQETMFAMLVEVTERLMAYVGSNDVLLVGGVGCNERLQEMMRTMAEARNAVCHSTDERYCIDNGLMIAYTGFLMRRSGAPLEEKCEVRQSYRTDTVDVIWRT